MTKRKPYVVQGQYNEQYYLRLTFGHCIVSVLLRALVCSLYFLCTTYGFCLFIVLSLYYIRFRLVIVFSLYYLRLLFVHCIVPVLHTAFAWSLCFLCTTYGFSVFIILSLHCLRQYNDQTKAVSSTETIQ
jgi:hypothetical protein